MSSSGSDSDVDAPPPTKVCALATTAGGALRCSLALLLSLLAAAAAVMISSPLELSLLCYSSNPLMDALFLCRGLVYVLEDRLNYDSYCYFIWSKVCVCLSSTPYLRLVSGFPTYLLSDSCCHFGLRGFAH